MICSPASATASRRRKDSVLSPASKLRARVLDVLQREGYIRGYREEALGDHAGLRIELKYFEGQPAIQHVARVSKPGRRVYSGAQELPRVRNGLGITIVSTPKGVLSRRRSAHAECRRRSARGGVLMSRIGKRPVPLPSGVTATTEGQILSVKGPEGHARRCRCATRSATTSGRTASASSRPTTTKQARAFWGMQRTLVQNLVTGVTEGFTKVLEITGVGYRAAAQGKKLNLQLGYSHDVNIAVPEGHRGQDAGHDHGRDFAASTGSRSARSPPRSAAGASPSPTRARASSIAASISSAKKARRSSHGEIQPLRSSARQRVRTALRRSAGGRAAPVGPPLGPAHLRAGHRRRRGPHRRRRLDAREGSPRPRPARPSLPRRRSAARSPSAPRPPASPRSCSIAAASCSTAASRRWPTPPAKADWSFDDG